MTHRMKFLVLVAALVTLVFAVPSCISSPDGELTLSPPESTPTEAPTSESIPTLPVTTEPISTQPPVTEPPLPSTVPTPTKTSPPETSLTPPVTPEPSPDPTEGAGEEPSWEFHDEGMDGMEFDIVFPKLGFSPVEVEGNMYQRLQLEGYYQWHEEGKPMLPHCTFTIALPIEGEMEIKILASSSEVIKSEYPVYPGAEQLPGCQGSAFAIDEELYSTDKFYPESPVRVLITQKQGGIPLAMVQVLPVRYNPVRSDLTVYSRLKFRIDFIGGKTFDLGEFTLGGWQTIRNRIVNDNIIPITD